jgi:hypothetical protein
MHKQRVLNKIFLMHYNSRFFRNKFRTDYGDDEIVNNLHIFELLKASTFR